MQLNTNTTIFLAGHKRTIPGDPDAESLAACIDGFYRIKNSTLSSIKEGVKIKRKLHRKVLAGGTTNIKIAYGASLYYLGVWNYIGENEAIALHYMRQYVMFANSNRSLRLPVSMAFRQLEILEILHQDPGFRKLRMLIRNAPKNALEYIDHCEKKVGKNGIVDHMYYVYWAVASFRTGHVQKAYWLSKKSVALSDKCTIAELVHGLMGSALFTGTRRTEAITILTAIRNRRVSTMLYSPCSVAETKIRRIRHLVQIVLNYLENVRGRVPASLFADEMLDIL